MLRRKNCANREEWLETREKQGIGGSEAAAVIGESKWMSRLDLWEMKTGRKKHKDMSANEAVSFGVGAEEHLRALFMLQHPELSLEYNATDILYQDDTPYIFATLDGELVDNESLERGILEIKTAMPRKADWEAWDGRVPTHYYAQICHQLLATGYEFAYLYAMLRRMDGTAELKSYYFLRGACKDSMDYLLDMETEFWEEYVQKDIMPSTILKI